MTTLPLDTHALVQQLQAAGFSDQQAEAVTQVFATTRDAFDLATKADLREVELRLETKIESTVSAAKFEIIKWVFGMTGFQTLVILGAVIALVKTVH